jgi:hypothetical protein
MRVTSKVTTVPATALFEHGNKAMVFRIEDGRARAREVHTGPLVETGLRRVIDGLTMGDEVVIFHRFYRHAGSLTAHNSYLQDNDLVDADWKRWTRRE